MLHIVYFHGFGGSPKSPKVDQLKTIENSVVYAFDIDIDPVISIPYLQEQIDLILASDPHEGESVLFVGTSLGAWYAAILGEKYVIPAFLINPSMDPATSLEKYGVPLSIREKYDPIKENFLINQYFFADKDPVINNTKLIEKLLPFQKVVVDSDDHTFNSQFHVVISKIESWMINNLLLKQ